MKPIYTFFSEELKSQKKSDNHNVFWKRGRFYLQFVIGMAEKGQTEANCNLGNTNEINNEVGEKREEEKVNSNIGDAYINLKDFRNAIKYLEIYLKLSKEVGDKATEGEVHRNLGNTYHRLGDFQKATEYHERHLEISKEVGDRAGEGIAYGNLGNAYHSLGDFQKAIEYHERHLKISKEGETGQEKEELTVILASPLEILEISRKP